MVLETQYGLNLNNQTPSSLVLLGVIFIGTSGIPDTRTCQGLGV